MIFIIRILWDVWYETQIWALPCHAILQKVKYISFLQSTMYNYICILWLHFRVVNFARGQRKFARIYIFHLLLHWEWLVKSYTYSIKIRCTRREKTHNSNTPLQFYAFVYMGLSGARFSLFSDENNIHKNLLRWLVWNWICNFIY